MAFAAAVLAAGFVVPWKLAVSHGRPQAIVMVMLGAAALLNSGGVLLRRGRSAQFEGRTTIWVAVVLAALTWVGNSASAASVARISGPLLSVMLRSEIIIIPALAWFLLRERVDRAFVVGAAMACVGVWVVNRPGTADPLGAETALGCAYAFGAAACFSCMAVITRKYIARIDPVAVNALRLWIAFLLAVAAHAGSVSMNELNAPLIVYASVAAIFGPGLSRLCMMYSARWVEARVTALVTLSSPVWTLLLCWIVIGTWPSGHELWGGGLMLLGVGLPIVLRLKGLWIARGVDGQPDEAPATDSRYP